MKGTDSLSYVFRNYSDTVYRIAVHNTDSAADAEDITQEVFLSLIKSAKTFRDSEHLKAWLIRVTLNKCHNYRRDKKHTVRTVEEPVADDVSDDFSVLEAVKKLPVNQRNAVYLHYYEGYTAKEIGRLMSVSTNTVLSWLKRSRSALKLDLEERGDA
ncbi:MAG: RNA polymerase sigma factor [Clostridia bacterium]|nr:RNA polymerase sigma factor [Clostridia bacterium]